MPGVRWAHSDIKSHYDSLVAADQLKFDAHQVKVVKNLHTLQKQLKGYEPHNPGLLEKVKFLFHKYFTTEVSLFADI